MSLSNSKKVLVCGATGFIGRNLLNHFLGVAHYEVSGTYHRTPPPQVSDPRKVRFLEADLTRSQDVEKVIQGQDIVIQAAATTSGAKEIVTRPHTHVTDNAVMNSLILRACHENRVKNFVFFSCTVMYPPDASGPVRESDFNYRMAGPYFGAGWTKVYIEKMCEFYSKIGQTKYAAIRHSNVYGPFDKYDSARSHVFGATVAKVMEASEGGKIAVWGDGSEKRDFLYVDDLVRFVDRLLPEQQVPFELINVGSGESVSVRDLASRIIAQSGKRLEVEFDKTKPHLPFSLRINSDRARSIYRWSPETSLEEGIRKTLDGYRSQRLEPEKVRE